MVTLWSANTGFAMPASTSQEAQYDTFSTSDTELSCRANRKNEPVGCFCFADKEDRGVGKQGESRH